MIGLRQHSWIGAPAIQNRTTEKPAKNSDINLGEVKILPEEKKMTDTTDRSTYYTAQPDDSPHWYAIRVFYNRLAPLLAELNEKGWEQFCPHEVIASLLFVRCSEAQVDKFAARNFDRMMVYRLQGSRRPAMIPDREMEIFRFVVTSGRQGLTLLGDDKPEYHQGDRVVVTQGPFKGAEGHIKRIKKDRRLVVTIPGVVAVATTYIHPDFLKKVD